MAVIAGNFAFSMRGEAQISRNLLSTAQAQALADAGAQRAWFELLKSPTDVRRWQANGLFYESTLDGATLRVSIQDETGKIDLNMASDALLHGLFKSVGLTEDESAALLDAVLDWRDADKLKRLHGAEEDDYRSAGKNYIPTNAPFETVDELQRVLGMTPELYRKLARSLTVYTQQPGVYTAAAPREVLLAIPGVDPVMVEQYLLQRQNLLETGQKVPEFAGAGAFSFPLRGVPTYSVRSEAKMADGTESVRQAVVRVVQDIRRPVTVLAWVTGEPEQLTEKR
jgi:general secretion pathway protein K